MLPLEEVAGKEFGFNQVDLLLLAFTRVLKLQNFLNMRRKVSFLSFLGREVSGPRKTSNSEQKLLLITTSKCFLLSRFRITKVKFYNQYELKGNAKAAKLSKHAQKVKF